MLSPKENSLKSNAKCVIITDNCSAHTSEEISSFLIEGGNIEIIFIPPHSSHIMQMLDATLFGKLKRKYESTFISGKYA